MHTNPKTQKHIHIPEERFVRSKPLHTFPKLFRNSQIFHLHTGGVSCFTTQKNSWTGSFRMFIVHGRARPQNGFEIGPNLAKKWNNAFCLQPEMEIPSFSKRTGLGPVRKTYRQMGLRNGISLGIRKKHIRIGNKFDCVEGVILLQSGV